MLTYRCRFYITYLTKLSRVIKFYLKHLRRNETDPYLKDMDRKLIEYS